MAISGLTKISFAPPWRALVSMANPAGSAGSYGTSSRSSDAMRARGGSSARRRRANLSTAKASPCASMRTPRSVLRTDPHKPHSSASRYTWGRKPTPCTCPVTIKMLPDFAGIASFFIMRLYHVARQAQGSLYPAMTDPPSRRMEGIFPLPGRRQTC